MIVLDANILLYAYDSASTYHQKARHWIEQIFFGSALIGIPWQTIGAFLRVVTNPRLPGERFTTQEAAQIVSQWLDQPNVLVLTPGENHWLLLNQILIESQAKGPLISDAQLAALTLEYGGVLYTTDRDFSRFPGLRWNNPLH